MQTAARVRPTKVGVAPGTTTIQLSGPTMATATVACDATPERTFWQQKRLWPAGKYRRPLPTVAEMAIGADVDGNRRILNPYATLESLKGPSPGLFKRKTTQAMAVVKQGLGRLGIIVAPYGDRSPQPSVSMTAAGRNLRPTCRGCRPTMPNDYQGAYTSAYMHDGGIGLDNVGLAGPSASFVAAGQPSYGGTYTSDGPPSMPPDTQLAPMRTYTPIIQQFIPFKEGNWPAPWRPPGGPTMLAGPQIRLLGNDAGDGTIVTPPVDPAQATLDALTMHQDRMYGIAILSAVAVASTAAINVFRYSNERRDARKRGGRVAAEPPSVISGTRRRRKR